MPTATPLPAQQRQWLMVVKEQIEVSRQLLYALGARDSDPADAQVFRVLKQAERRANEALSRLASGSAVTDAECVEIADLADSALALWYSGGGKP